jgi:hypothetical protein
MIAGELLLAGDLANADYPLLRPLLLRLPLEHVGALGEQLIFKRFGIMVVNQAQCVANMKGIQARENERVTLAGHDTSYIEILNNWFSQSFINSLYRTVFIYLLPSPEILSGDATNTLAEM